MKKQILIQRLACAAGGVLVVMLSGCAASRTETGDGGVEYRRSTGTYLDDQAIAAKVKASMIDDEIVPGGAVKVEVYQGVVQLSGFVDTQEQKEQAERVARGVNGVKDVKNAVALKPSSKGTEPTGRDTAQRGSESSLHAPLSAEKLIGMNVTGKGGEKLGTVKDFVIDPHQGHLHFAVISSGGVFGIGDRLHAVPPGAFTYQGEGRHLVMNISRERWKDAPVFEKDRLTGLWEESRQNEIYAYYELDWKGEEKKVEAGVVREKEGDLTPAGRENAQRETGRFWMASDLIGKTIRDRQDKTVGEIEDLMVDLRHKGRVMALVDLSNTYLQGEAARDRDQFLISLRSMELSGRHLVMEVNPGLFERAEAFESQKWHQLTPTGDPTVYYYRGGDFHRGTEGGKDSRDRR